MITIKFLCPLCRKIIQGQVPEIGAGEIGSVGFAHDGHVTIVDYDYHGVVRSVNAISMCNPIDGDSIKCPRCNKSIKIPNDVTEYSELAYVHEDHVAIVYVFDRTHYAIDIINIASVPNNSEPNSNVIKNLISEVGLTLAAKLLVERLILGKTNLEAPKEALIQIDKIIKELNLPREISIDFSRIPTENLSYTFFENFLTEIQILPREVAFFKLKNLIKVIKKYIILLDYFSREGMEELIEEFLNQIYDKNLSNFIAQINVLLGDNKRKAKKMYN
ncbi:MAG: hypothetical protein ACTSVW_00115 [Candidatus Njordarchaeales archaeon]